MPVLRMTGRVLFWFLMTASAAHAAPIFTQSAYNDAFPSDREFDTLIADDFTLAANEVIRSVSWLGTYAFDGTAPAVDDFQIRFYADAAGSPGALLQSFAVGDAVARAAVGMLGPFMPMGTPRISAAASVPEPASFLLVGVGLAAAARRKRLHR